MILLTIFERRVKDDNEQAKAQRDASMAELEDLLTTPGASTSFHVERKDPGTFMLVLSGKKVPFYSEEGLSEAIALARTSGAHQEHPDKI